MEYESPWWSSSRFRKQFCRGNDQVHSWLYQPCPQLWALAITFSLSGMSCPPSLSVLLLFVTVQMSPPLSPVPLENVIGCNYVVPKTFHIGTGTFCACVWLLHKVMDSSKGRDCILFIPAFSPAPCMASCTFRSSAMFVKLNDERYY